MVPGRVVNDHVGMIVPCANEPPWTTDRYGNGMKRTNDPGNVYSRQNRLKTGTFTFTFYALQCLLVENSTLLATHG